MLDGMLNKIILGDCLDVMRQMPDKCVDCIVTSPPYDDLRDYNNSSEWGFEVFKNIANEIKRVLRNSGVCVWIVNDRVINGSKSLSSFNQAIYFKEIGMNIHDVMIWNKGSYNYPDLKRYGNTFEYMLIVSKGTPAVVNKIKDRKNVYVGSNIHGTARKANGSVVRKTNTKTVIAEYGERFNIWNISPCNSSNERCGHPAPFAIKLAKDHILSWTDENNIVLDPFMGSGTTAIAALATNRQFIGIEIDPEYHRLACARVAKEQHNLFSGVA